MDKDLQTIVLATRNARYIHTAFGLRYLLANMNELAASTRLLEFTHQDQPEQIVESILANNPVILGLGVYIWNLEPLTEVARSIKKTAPGIKLILGGPEVSYPENRPEICDWADHVICGEADLAFADMCRGLMAGRHPAGKFIASSPPPLENINLPYAGYNSEDVAHRILYAETSRGCPFQCEYCLSSRDPKVRYLPEEQILEEIKQLLSRGARHIKFTDRTFNMDIQRTTTILDSLASHVEPGMTLHFEMVPDRLPHMLRESILRFPKGVLHLELGIQTYNPLAAHAISRTCDWNKADENIRFLVDEAHVTTHVDLIAGLPGEDLGSFGRGFDRLASLHPHEIQVGILKGLRGAPIKRHSSAFAMRYNEHPPYEILATSTLSMEEVSRVKRFARYWDRTANRHRFPRTQALLWTDGGSPFQGFMAFSDWLFERTGCSYGISLRQFTEHLFTFLTQEKHISAAKVAESLIPEYQESGKRRDLPMALREYI